MEDNLHAFYMTAIVLFAGLLAIALYWMARCESAIKDLTDACLRGAHHLSFASGVIEGQRERIRELEAEIDELRCSNIVELRRGPRQ